MFNKNEITLRVDVVYISFWKGQLSQYNFVKETFCFNYFIGRTI